MHIAFVTAGGAGMFCGSCMQDNAIARALMQLDCEVSLIPTYTPIRVDQENMSQTPVYLGGINLYLDNSLGFWKHLPRPLVSWLDHPRVIKWATSFGIKNDGADLGPMTLSMLNGESGPMQREYQVFVDHLVDDLKPDVILFTNALLSGVMPLLNKRYSKPIFCLLQGDDLFLNQLPAQYRQTSIDSIRKNSEQFAGFITHTRVYADLMSEFLGIDRNRFLQIPLSVDVEAHEVQDRSTSPSNTPKIGYFARIAPEKGLLELVQATRHLHEAGIDFELHAGGYLGPQHRSYFKKIQSEAKFLGDRFQYIGSPAQHSEKMEFLRQLHLLSVPANYEEPKGLYLLEAMAAGIPVVQPRRGSFPELIESTGGGLMYEPGNSRDHANSLRQLLENPELHLQHRNSGLEGVNARHTSKEAAKALLKICRDSVESP